GDRPRTRRGDPQWSTGHTGGALSTSAGNYMVIPGYTGILGTSSRTCTAWIKTTTADGVIIGWGLLSGGNKWIMRVNQVGGGGQLRCEVDAGYHYGTTKVNDDEWRHVAVVLEDDGSPDIAEVRLFVDGVLDADNADLADEPINTIEDMDVTIGQNPQSLGTRSFGGLLDEIRIYDRALTQAEIQAVMNEAGQGFPVARAPSPEDGSLYENTWANLAWRPGDFAVSNDIYFGTNFDDVNDGAEAAFAGNTATASQVVGFPGFPASDGLQPGVTYYWRVDGINDADPNSPWKGDVWSFFVPPRTAYNPDPADGARFIDTDVTLNWTGGFDAKLHSVYFGDNPDDVAGASGALPQTDATFAPGELELEKTYYWRIDEFDGAATHTGDVWSFTTIPVIPIHEDPNFVAWWKLDENMGTTALDWSGHGNHSTLVGPKWTVHGRHGDAGLSLTSGTYLTIENLTYNSTDLTEVTVCTWISTMSSGQQYIASFDRDNYWRLEINGSGGGPGQVGWDVMTSSGQVDHGSFTRVDDGRWRHVCGVFDKGRMTIYIDGQAEPSVTGGSTFGSGNARPGIIGGNSEAGGYNGGNPVQNLDDLRIYDRALTQDEIVLVMRGDPLLA
ncbi:MAG: LamG domain-containing protein, partial [Planctomycetota bacterium]|nr:LamG domain-containing protein [Planctomycetota bacterium]